MRVLIVEDNQDHALLIEEAMRSEFAVEHVDRLQKAVDHPELSTFDIVLCDLSLPDGTGVDNVTRIRDRLPELPLIVLTCLQDERAALEAIDAGAQDYLIKTEVLQNTQIAELTLRRAACYAIQRQAAVVQERKLVAELRASKQLLEHKNRRLEELYATAQRFVDNVSHEFRTPLTVIKEFASLLRDGLVGEVNDEQAAMLNVVDDRADDLNTMVDDMLDVSKLEAGLLGVCRESCDLQDVIDHVMPALERKASVHNVSLETMLPDDLPCVWCDEEKVGRIVINLVVNAIKFSGEPGVVRLWAEPDRTSREVVIRISDNGPGIPNNKLTEIFERFRQPVTSVRQSTKGFGLGLGIAKELVDLNLGTMSVASDGRQGSIFTFTLPLAEPLEVMRRQFARLRESREDAADICLALTAKGCDEEKELSDFELFLQQGLHPHDQLFRIDETRWAAAIAVSPLEFERFVERLTTDHRELSRNRPRGPLLDWDINFLGSWQLTSCSDDEIFDAYLRCVENREVCYV